MEMFWYYSQTSTGFVLMILLWPITLLWLGWHILVTKKVVLTADGICSAGGHTYLGNDRKNHLQ
jgi:hypothetical protein